MKKKILSLLALSLAFSCNAPSDLTISKLDSKVTSFVKQEGRTYVIDASQGKSTKGADLTFNLGKAFSVKQSSQGTVNLFGSVKSYVVYLVSDVSGVSFSGTDPIGNKVLGPFVFNVNNNVFPSVRFTNVPSSGANFYYVAVRALDGLDGTGTDLIKTDNASLTTPWTGTTAGLPFSGKIAVSSGAGINVDANYVVSPTTAPIVNINTTLGATGAAVLDARLKFLNTASTSVASYSVNLCTDPTRPVATKVLTVPLVMPKNPSFTDDVFQLTNVSQGTYYLTVSPVRDKNLNSPNLIAQLGLPNADTSDNIAVSSNSVTIDNNQQYSFYNSAGVLDTATWFNISVPLVSKVIYPITSSAISVTPVYQPSTAVAPDGTTYISDVQNTKIIKIASDGTQSDFITGLVTGNMTTDSSGNLYVTNQTSNQVEVYDNMGALALTIANNPTPTPLVKPTAVAVDGEGNIYVSEIVDTVSASATYGSSMVYKYDSTGAAIGTVAGGGAMTGDVSLLSATLIDARFISDIIISPDSSNLYILEQGVANPLPPAGSIVPTSTSGLVRLVENGTIRSIVGGGVGLSSPARAITLNQPSGIELDKNGFLYITDTGNNVVRKYDAMNNGAISFFAGNGASVPTTVLQLIGSTSAKLNRPFGLALDPVGNVYLTDQDNVGTSVRILKVTK